MFFVLNENRKQYHNINGIDIIIHTNTFPCNVTLRNFYVSKHVNIGNVQLYIATGKHKIVNINVIKFLFFLDTNRIMMDEN